MPAYSFKERFVPMIVDKSKRQTVRSYRKDGALPVIGKWVHLFFGMRTKACKRLNFKNEDEIRMVKTIFILADGRIFLSNIQTKENAEGMLLDLPYLKFHCDELKGLYKDRFAWLDGFRPENSTKEAPGEAFELMIRFWKLTHELPFAGTITYW